MLGFYGAEKHFYRSEYGIPQEKFILDEVKCTGDEDSILQCDANPLFVNDCDEREAAGVKCKGFGPDSICKEFPNDRNICYIYNKKRTVATVLEQKRVVNPSLNPFDE